jgi:hypothetical protein
MQTVLSIDLSCDPSWVELVEVEDRTVKVIEAHSASLPALHNYLFSPTAELGAPPPPASQAPGASASAVASGQEAVTPGSTQWIPKPVEELKNALAGFEGKWSSAVVVLPTPEYLSLNVELPFDDPKQINKILPLEIQDRIPFDAHEFLIEHTVIGDFKNGDGKLSKDVHVCLVPRRSIARLLEICKKLDVEPRIVSSPSTFIAGALHLAPNYFAPHCALVQYTPGALYVSLVQDGKVKGDRVIQEHLPTADASSEEEKARRFKELLVNLKLTLSSFENRYGTPLNKVYFIGGSFSREELQQVISRNVETLTVSELTGQAPASSARNYSGVATLAALYAQDGEAPAALVNFRAQEFAYNPRLRELLRGARELMPYVLSLALLVVLAFSSVYYTRARYIQQLNSAIAEKVRTTMGEGEIIPGNEIESLRAQINRLLTQLRDLGSLSRYSPLDAFVEVTKDFPPLPGVNPRAINIKNNRIRIEGVVPEYTTAEKIERVFKEKKQKYVRTKMELANTTIPGSNARPFTLELFLAE